MILAIFTILFLLLAAWALLVVPQQRQQRAHRELVAALAVGQEVITTAGVYGTISALDGEIVQLEIAPGTVIRIARLAILRAVMPDAPPSPVSPARTDEA